MVIVQKGTKDQVVRILALMELFWSEPPTGRVVIELRLSTADPQVLYKSGTNAGSFLIRMWVLFI